MRQSDQALILQSLSVDALPWVNLFLQRLGIDALLEQHLAAPDRRYQLSPAKTLGVLLRNLLLARVPLYSLPEWAQQIAPPVLGLSAEQVALLNDDRVGRALDVLFAADRATLLTRLVVRTVRAFEVNLSQLHNDSTTVTFAGDYPQANGRKLKGKRALSICRGHNKDHRPDLKQLLFVLTVSADGAVPIHFQSLDGNTTDVETHMLTWEVLRSLAGRPDFLYVADCKLCSQENMNHIDHAGGRFVTILPRNRREDAFFRDWLQQHTPTWQVIARRSNPRHATGPADVYQAMESPIPSAEGLRIVWVHSSLKVQRDQQAREEKIHRAIHALTTFHTRLRGPRSRYKSRASVEEAATLRADLQAGKTRTARFHNALCAPLPNSLRYYLGDRPLQHSVRCTLRRHLPLHHQLPRSVNGETF
jgi:transposase